MRRRKKHHRRPHLHQHTPLPPVRDPSLLQVFNMMGEPRQDAPADIILPDDIGAPQQKPQEQPPAPPPFEKNHLSYKVVRQWDLPTETPLNLELGRYRDVVKRRNHPYVAVTYDGDGETVQMGALEAKADLLAGVSRGELETGSSKGIHPFAALRATATHTTEGTKTTATASLIARPKGITLSASLKVTW